MSGFWRLVGAVVVLVVAAAGATTAVDLALHRPAPTYVTVPIERGDIRVSVTAVGRVEPMVTVEVGSQISGQIAELLADFNDEVKSGQTIARLDKATYAAQLRSAEAVLEAAGTRVSASAAALRKTAADLSQAQASRRAATARVAAAIARRDDAEREVARRRSLVGRGNLASSEGERAEADYAVSQADVDAAEAQVAMADAATMAAAADVAFREAAIAEARAAVRQQEAQVEQARVDLDRAEIKAPIDGIIIARKVDQGQTVAASLEAPTLFTIANSLERVEVHARVDEADIGVVRPEQEVSFTVDAFPGRSFQGRVRQIRKAPEVLANVVTYNVLIDAANPNLVLLPGMTATVEIIIRSAEQILKVPEAALRFRAETDPTVHAGGPGEAQIWILDPEAGVRPVPVAVGLSDLAYIEIRSAALAPGTQVAVGTVPIAASWLERLGMDRLIWWR